MTNFLESSLSLIVLAIIVSVRLVLFLRKRAESRTRNPPPPLVGVEAIETEGTVFAPDDGDEDFSAWDLAAEEPEEPVPPPEIPKAVPSPAPAFDAWPQPYAEEPAASAAAKTSPARMDGVFWRKLRDLPPLTQGVILSEILGPPKSL
ncbi:MAG: hypothetical protein LBE17_09475 [Treponema sp.]|nr:hypothetical protein [Treponema sp.]